MVEYFYNICHQINKFSKPENDPIEFDIGPTPCYSNLRIFKILFEETEKIKKCPTCKEKGLDTPEYYNMLIDFCLLLMGEPGCPIWPTISNNIDEISDDKLRAEIKRVLILIHTLLSNKFYKKSGIDWYNLDRYNFLESLTPSSSKIET